MGPADWFRTFCGNIQVQNGAVISHRYEAITKSPNTDFRRPWALRTASCERAWERWGHAERIEAEGLGHDALRSRTALVVAFIRVFSRKEESLW